MEPAPEIKEWVRRRLIDFRKGAGLSVADIIAKTRLSRAGIEKMEKPDANPTIDSLAQYVEACGKTLGEFFEPLIPPHNPRYDRHVHRVISDALQHPRAKSYLKSLVGLLSEAMRPREDLL